MQTLKNHKDFMKMIEAHYGVYPSEFLRTEIYNWVKSNIPVEELDNLYKAVVLNFSNQFKVPPDIAVFNQYFNNEDALKLQAIQYYEKLTNEVNSYKNIAFEDIRVQAVVQALGGWVAFCNRDPSRDSFHRKEFINLFILYSHNRPMIEHTVLKGLVDITETIYIGDPDKIKPLLENKSKPISLPNFIKRLDDHLKEDE